MIDAFLDPLLKKFIVLLELQLGKLEKTISSNTQGPICSKRKNP